MSVTANTAKDSLKKYTDRYVSLSSEALDALAASCEHSSYQKKDFLFEAGQVCRYQYFVLEGVFRSFYIDEKGGEQVLHFAIENWWMTDYESWTNETPTELYLQALEKSTVLRVSKSALYALFDQYPLIERLFRIIAEKTFIASQNRLRFMLSMTREETLHDFMGATNPFSERVPQYMIASYLGFTPEFLSMIRTRNKQRKD